MAAEVGCAVNTVRSHLGANTAPRYKRNKLRVTKLSPFEDYLRERQAAAHPAWIPSTFATEMARKVMLVHEPAARLSTQPQACFTDRAGSAIRDHSGRADASGLGRVPQG